MSPFPRAPGNNNVDVYDLEMLSNNSKRESIAR